MVARMVRGLIAVAVLAGLLTVSGCAGAGNERDMDGMTRAEVAELSVAEEMVLLAGRYERMQEILRDAQLQISDGSWRLLMSDVLPWGGSTAAGAPLRGAKSENTYYVKASRLIEQSATPVGGWIGLETMRAYFADRGWSMWTEQVRSSTYLTASTGDGWYVEFVVRTNGYFSLGVSSERFWTNDSLALLQAVVERSVDGPSELVPGEYHPFPRWDDPIIRSF